MESSTAAGDDSSLTVDVDSRNGMSAPPQMENPEESALYEHWSIEDNRERPQVDGKARRASRRTGMEPRHSQILEEGYMDMRPTHARYSRTSMPPTIAHLGQSPTQSSEDTAAAIPPDIPRERARTSRHIPISKPSALLFQLYTISYLIFFSILGVLARLGLDWLTFYPGAPVITPVLWANFTGCLIMGYLQEDPALFQKHHATSHPSSATNADPSHPKPLSTNTPNPRTHLTHKKTIPLYIGLTVGFCGTLTSFSAFILDTFLALSNDLPLPISPPTTPPFPPSPSLPRYPAYSLLSTLSLPLLTLSISLSAFSLGSHLSLLLSPHLPSLPRSFCHLDRLFLLLAPAAWLAFILLSALPPSPAWRPVTLPATFAPLGCLLRYALSQRLNGVAAGFPLGTFTANVFGTAVAAVGFVLGRMELAGRGVGGGTAACAVLGGLVDGFAGGCSTVSTWVAELKSLRKRHAYVYGGVSVGVALGVAVAVMGGVRWGVGWRVACGAEL
ncbi:hypothetical protein P152DRAFT_464368 [Eremomyces bilateralis CBS 781.70]|uniref:Uncharacterized protein n=1 Tax=Eremomyces bilateralis CBS 781.70 TaxID=1392243 RepID=A0A6G1GCB2_9PEZI|nr:uncharacterized protein P152DRAFT_464368 [Eremomyces bilateralis CBS 781.70]KAF1815541.1 hypothetical protein P152DRAFT_464368 [Eremomyces bilateralis CBS 781.70]